MFGTTLITQRISHLRRGVANIPIVLRDISTECVRVIPVPWLSCGIVPFPSISLSVCLLACHVFTFNYDVPVCIVSPRAFVTVWTSRSFFLKYVFRTIYYMRWTVWMYEDLKCCKYFIVGGRLELYIILYVVQTDGCNAVHLGVPRGIYWWS